MGEVVDEMRRKNRELTSRRAESCRVKVAGWRVNENRSSPTLQRRMMIWECNHGEWMSQQHGIPWEDRSGGKKSFARNARESPFLISAMVCGSDAGKTLFLDWILLRGSRHTKRRNDEFFSQDNTTGFVVNVRDRDGEFCDSWKEWNVNF